MSPRRLAAVAFFSVIIVLFVFYWFLLAPYLWRLWTGNSVGNPLVFWLLVFAVWCVLMAVAALIFFRRKTKPRIVPKCPATLEEPIVVQERSHPAEEAVPNKPTSPQPPLLAIGPKMSLAFDEGQVPEYRKKKSFEFNFILEQNVSLSTAWFIEYERDACCTDWDEPKPQVPESPSYSKRELNNARELFFKDLIEGTDHFKSKQSPEGDLEGREVLERCVRTVDALYIENEWQSKPEKHIV